MEDLRLVTTEEFNGVDCNFYKADCDMWMTRRQIGQALGYSNPRLAITKIHQAHADRLDPLSSSTVSVLVEGRNREATIYNERGIFEICRWSRQPKANEFMDWVWDIVEAYRRGEFQRKPRETAITPVEKFLDGMQNMFLEMREENRVFKDTVLKILESQQTIQPPIEKPVEVIAPEEVKSTCELPIPNSDDYEKISWKASVYFRIDYIMKYSNDFATRGKALSSIYKKMTNVYGIVWYEENKEYKRNFGLIQSRVSQLDVCFYKEDLKDLFESILDGMVETVRRWVEKELEAKEAKAETEQKEEIEINPEKDWQYYKEKIRELCEKTGNKSIGGTSVYSVIIRKMDVDWSKYETNKKKTELVRKYPKLFAEFSKTADKYLEEKLK